MASVITQTIVSNSRDWRVIKFACTAHTDGTFTSVTTEDFINKFIRGWALYKLQYVCGATAPTDNSDCTLKDSNGIDLLGGQGANIIDASGAAEIYPKISDQAANNPVLGTLTLAITNNIVNAATFSLFFTFRRPN